MTPVARRGAGRSRSRGDPRGSWLPIATKGYLSPWSLPADNSCMRSLSMRGAGLVAALVISGVLWLYGHGGGSATATSQAYCHDVDRLSSVLTDVRQSGTASSQAATLASIGSSLRLDAAGRGSPAAGPSPSALAPRGAPW